MDHLGEFLYQVCSAEYREGQQKNSCEGQKDYSVENTISSSLIQQSSASVVQRPEHFYVYVRFKEKIVFSVFLCLMLHKRVSIYNHRLLGIFMEWFIG